MLNNLLSLVVATVFLRSIFSLPLEEGLNVTNVPALFEDVSGNVTEEITESEVVYEDQPVILKKINESETSEVLTDGSSDEMVFDKTEEVKEDEPSIIESSETSQTEIYDLQNGENQNTSSLDGVDNIEQEYDMTDKVNTDNPEQFPTKIGNNLSTEEVIPVSDISDSKKEKVSDEPLGSEINYDDETLSPIEITDAVLNQESIDESTTQRFEADDISNDEIKDSLTEVDGGLKTQSTSKTDDLSIALDAYVETSKKPDGSITDDLNNEIEQNVEGVENMETLSPLKTINTDDPFSIVENENENDMVEGIIKTTIKNSYIGISETSAENDLDINSEATSMMDSNSSSVTEVIGSESVPSKVTAANEVDKVSGQRTTSENVDMFDTESSLMPSDVDYKSDMQKSDTNISTEISGNFVTKIDDALISDGTNGIKDDNLIGNVEVSQGVTKPSTNTDGAEENESQKTISTQDKNNEEQQGDNKLQEDLDKKQKEMNKEKTDENDQEVKTDNTDGSKDNDDKSKDNDVKEEESDKAKKENKDEEDEEIKDKDDVKEKEDEDKEDDDEKDDDKDEDDDEEDDDKEDDEDEDDEDDDEDKEDDEDEDEDDKDDEDDDKDKKSDDDDKEDDEDKDDDKEKREKKDDDDDEKKKKEKNNDDD